MQDVTVGSHSPSSNIRILPIIDLNPNDKSCMLSTLLFVIDQSKILNMEVPCITFDQALWIRAVEVILREGLNNK